jgi:hypothetical protein
LYGKFNRGKTLTTQVVRRSHFKKRRRASSRVPQSELLEGKGIISEEEEGTTMNTQPSFSSRKINLHLLHSFYSSTPFLIALCLSL